MLGKLSDLVTGESVGAWLLIALLVVYFVYKEWPEFRKRVSSGAVKEQKEELTVKTVNERLTSIEDNLRQVNEKLERDYKRLNRFEDDLQKSKNSQNATAEELEIIMEALMGALGGLQELGANGPTKEAKSKIQDYLNRKAHLSRATE